MPGGSAAVTVPGARRRVLTVRTLGPVATPVGDSFGPAAHRPLLRPIAGLWRSPWAPVAVPGAFFRPRLLLILSTRCF